MLLLKDFGGRAQDTAGVGLSKSNAACSLVRFLRNVEPTRVSGPKYFSQAEDKAAGIGEKDVGEHPEFLTEVRWEFELD